MARGKGANSGPFVLCLHTLPRPTLPSKGLGLGRLGSISGVLYYWDVMRALRGQPKGTMGLDREPAASRLSGSHRGWD